MGMELSLWDSFCLLVFGIASGFFLATGLTKWFAHQEKVAIKSGKPVKEITPELIHHRIVKAQWRLLERRMSNLTTAKKPKQSGLSGGISDISSVRVERRCVGVISLGVDGEKVRYNDSPLYQPMPLCVENREKLVGLGFKEFSEDGMWVYYVEPLSMMTTVTKF